MKRLGGYSKNLSSFEKIIYKFNSNLINILLFNYKVILYGKFQVI